MAKQRSQTHWSVDKKVPVALLVALFIHGGGFIWWGSNITNRVTVLEKTADMVAPQAERLTRLEVKLESALDSLTEIKRLIQQRTR